jgi:hypothetical protein
MNMKTKFFTSKIIFHVISNGNKKRIHSFCILPHGIKNIRYFFSIALYE